MAKHYSIAVSTFFLVSGFAANAQRVTQNLVAYFPFSEGNGIYMADHSGYGEPMMLKVAYGACEWPAEGGVKFSSPGLIKSLGNADKIAAACGESNEISMELWVKSDMPSQDGPARMMSCGFGTSHRNFMLGQQGDKFLSRLRTTTTGNNGTPNLESPAGSVGTLLKHLVYTRSSSGEDRLFINGVQVASSTRSGDFSSWNANYELAFFNELDASRPWLGTIYLAAVYNSALSSAEVNQNYLSGAVQSGSSYSESGCSSLDCFVDGYGADQRSLWLNGLPFASGSDYVFQPTGGGLDVFADGTAHLYGATWSTSDPEAGWYLDLWLSDAMDWNEWSALGRSWKGNPALVGDLYTTWTYYIVDPGASNVLIGLGSFEGSTLSLSHRPANYEFGFQYGTGANDKNLMPGMSVWLDIEGEMNGQSIDINGDLNLEGECISSPSMQCPSDIEIGCTEGSMPDLTGWPEVLCGGEYSLTYTDEIIHEPCPVIVHRQWVVEFADGSEAICTQEIQWTDTIAPAIDPLVFLEEGCNMSELLAAAISDHCDPSPEFTYSIIDSTWVSPEPCEPGMYRTQTQGGWGSVPSGNNPGAFLHAHFSEVFPNGITIGCNNTLTLTTAQSITDFLPSGSTPSALPSGNLLNPGAAYSNVFAGQLVAATISVNMDNVISDFGSGSIPLGELQVIGGVFEGWSVNEILEEANRAIGGCGSSYSFSQLNNVLSSINQNFVDGTTNEGFLDCSVPFDCYLLLSAEIVAWDNCGNMTLWNGEIIVPDTTAPSFDGWPTELHVSCDSIPELPAMSECFSEWNTLDVTETLFSGGCLPAIQRIYSASDACGNSASFTQYIFVHDHVAPVFDSEPDDVVLSCGGELPMFLPVVTDNCDPSPVITLSEITIGNECNYTITRTWTATDHCGNVATIDQVIQVSDQEAPQITGVSQIYATCSAVGIEDPVISDNCDANVQIVFEESMEYIGCTQWITRTWTASDECGNVSAFTQTIEVSDDVPPTFVFVPSDVTLTCGSPMPVVDAQAVDNCSEVTVSVQLTEQQSEGNCSQWLRVWTATDACGNTAIASQVVYFEDDVSPVLIGIPADVSGNCGEIEILPEVVATDNCDDDVEVVLTETFSQSDCGITIVRLWTATDNCGNQATGSQTLTIADNAAPVIEGVAQVNASCNEDTWMPPVATDDCSEVDLVYSDLITGGSCSTIITRTWIASDACGNSTSWVQQITVSDTIAPVFVSVPQDITLACGSSPWLEEPVAEDNCDDSPSVSMSEQTETTDCEIIIVRTWIATDNCGNSAVAEQVIVITDNETPVLNGIPADVTLDCSNAVMPDIPVVTATDDCSDVEITYEEVIAPGACAQEWTITRIWTATDACGNAVTGIQEIMVADTSAPVFTLVPEDIWVDCGNMPEPGEVLATDNCDPEVTISFEEVAASGGCPLINRIWTATDDCGNSSQYVQAIHIVDNEPPVLSGIPPVLEASCNNIGPLPEPQVADNCDNNVAVTFTQSTIGSGCEFMIVRTWIAEDDCGNSSVISQSVMVTDTAPPVFVSTQPEITVNCTQLGSLSYPTVTDDCGNSVMITYTDVPLGDGCSYDIQRTYLAQDLCGNQASSVQIIHVVDNTPPVLTGAPLNMNVSCSNIPQPATVTGWDACSGSVNVSFQENILGGGCFYQILRVWSATDNCGNTAFASQMIFVSDALAPVITGVPSSMVISCDDMIPPPAQPVATDNCATNLVLTFTESTQNVSCGIVITRTWSTQDLCGNVAQVSQTISVLDQQAPVFTYVPQNMSLTCDQLADISPALAMDNCSSATVTYVDQVVAGGCPYTVFRTWSATDLCGNTAQLVQEIQVYDAEAPVIWGPTEDLVLECGDDIPEYVVYATDNCIGYVSVEFNQSVMEDGCTETIHRVWTASDYCGNETVLEQFIIISDTQAPQAVAPSDLYVSCDQVPQPAVLNVSDCHEYDVVFVEQTLESSCENEYVMLRTWQVADVCGNVAEYSQLVEVVDTIAPTFEFLPQDILVDCNTIPGIADMVAIDNCDGDVGIVFEETVNWISENDTTCILSNTLSPAGEVVVLLPGFGGYSDTYIFDEAGGMMVEDPLTGTAHLTGYVYAPSNPEQAWYLDVYLREKSNWEQWSALGRSYKDDMQLAGDSYLDWSYFEMDEASRLIGAGIFEGSELNLTHAPSDFYYGFQLGLAANNTNAEYGLSGWMFYEGEVNGVYYSGPGDIMTQNQCCPEHEIIRTWVATDCAGNSTTWVQTISVDPHASQSLPLLMTDDGRNYLEVADGNRQQFVVSFELFFGGQVNLDLYSSSGQFLERVYSGSTERGMRYTIQVPKSGLSSGMYHFVLSAPNGVFSDRGLVTR